MQQEYGIKNIFKNTTRGQKVVAGLFVLIVVILVVVLIVLVMGNAEEDLSDDDGSGDNGATEVVEGTQGLDTGDGGGNVQNVEVPVSTKFEENHNYTLIEYLPKGEYAFLNGEESDEDSVVYYYISENTAIDKGIVVSVDSCDEEGNTTKANDYLKSLPVDLSEYVIVYETHTGDVPCDVQATLVPLEDFDE